MHNLLNDDSDRAQKLSRLLRFQSTRDKFDGEIQIAHALNAAYQQGIETAAKYVHDRAHQYVPSSGIHDALLQAAWQINEGEATKASAHGELDDIKLKKPKKKAAKKRRPT